MVVFKVQRVVFDVPPAGGNRYLTTPVTGTSSALELLGNNRKSSAGALGTATNLEADDLSVAVELVESANLAFTRVATSSTFTMRASVEVWEYLGDAGDINEFVVRGRYTANLNAGVASRAVTVSGVSNIDKCIPFITGIRCEETTDGGARATAYAILDSATQLTVHCGGSSGRTAVQVVLVEFTGSNWAVGHGVASSSADTGTISLVNGADGTSGGAFAVSAWAAGVIFGQHKGDNLSDTNEAIADNWPLFEPGSSTSTVNWTFQADHATSTQVHVAHVLAHANMAVQRMSDTQATAGAMNVTIPSALPDLESAFVVVSRTSSGTGTDYGRGWVNAQITSTTNVQLWAHRSGNTVASRVQVVDLSRVTSTPNIVPSSIEATTAFGTPTVTLRGVIHGQGAAHTQPPHKRPRTSASVGGPARGTSASNHGAHAGGSSNII